MMSGNSLFFAKTAKAAHQNDCHYYWARQVAKGRAVAGPQFYILLSWGQVRMSNYPVLRKLTVETRQAIATTIF